MRNNGYSAVYLTRVANTQYNFTIQHCRPSLLQWRFSRTLARL